LNQNDNVLENSLTFPHLASIPSLSLTLIFSPNLSSNQEPNS
jgi:hypothetical protein